MMMEFKRSKTKIDYPFLISIGGIGFLIAIACLMFGYGTGNIDLALQTGALIVLLTSFLILYLIRDRFTALSVPILRSSLRHVEETPNLLTTTNGEMVYCNDAFRDFSRRMCGGVVRAPFEMTYSVEEEFTQLKKAVRHLRIEGELNQRIQFLDSNDNPVNLALSIQYDSRGLCHWQIEEHMPLQQEVLHVKNEADILDKAYEQYGAIFDLSESGFMVIDQAGDLVFVNKMVRNWLFDGQEQDVFLPCPMAGITNVNRDKLMGQVDFNTSVGEVVTLDIIPTNEAYGAEDGSSCYIVMSREGQNTDGGINPHEVSIDRFFLESPIGIAVVTDQGDVLERNVIFRDFVRALGIDKRRNIRNIIATEAHQEFFEKINETLISGTASTIPDIGFQGSGDKHGQLYITCLENFATYDKVVILYLIDTTEQKSLELQFAQSQKMQAVGQLAGGIAHDFNNLLTAITGFSDLLLVRHGPGDQSFSDIIQIKQNANRAANLVRQLLAFSRQQTLRPKVLSITDVLAEISNLLRRLIGENIELHMNHGRDLGAVKVDQGQLEQVIINLCVNARDAMADGGNIIIKTSNISRIQSEKISARYKVMPPNDYVLLEVEDSGTGIAKEHLGKIFEPFFSTKEVGKGTGLGLSTVYGIVKQTDGFIFPTSEVGKGTIFSIYLPVHKSIEGDVEEVRASEAVKEKPAKDLTGKASILLVEDEAAVRMFASRALKNKGYKVYEASSGDAALKILDETKGKLDLLISDVVMPQMDGPTLVRKIREKNVDLKVIFISGYAEDAFDKNLGEEDFHFLPKPFSLKQLAEEVKEVLES